MNLLPDFIDPQPEPELVNTLRELGERVLSEHGTALPPIAVEVLAALLTTGKIEHVSEVLDLFNYDVHPPSGRLPEWATHVLYATHQLMITNKEIEEREAFHARGRWHYSARAALYLAQKELTTTHESVT